MKLKKIYLHLEQTKKSFSIRLFSRIFLFTIPLILFASCQEEQSNEISGVESRKNLESFARTIQNGDFFKGSVIFRTYKDNGILVYLKADRFDSQIKRVYLLQRNDENAPKLNKTIKDAFISINTWSVTVFKDGEAITLLVSSEAGRQVLEKTRKEFPQTKFTTFEGYGFGRYNREIEKPEMDKELSAIEALTGWNKERAEGRRIDNCTSGGIGATACSISGTLNGCSVTCGSTPDGEMTYACCDDDEVVCKCLTADDIRNL